MHDFVYLRTRFSNSQFKRVLNENGPPDGFDLTLLGNIRSIDMAKKNFGHYLYRYQPKLFRDMANKWRIESIPWDLYSENLKTIILRLYK